MKAQVGMTKTRTPQVASRTTGRSRVHQFVFIFYLTKIGNMQCKSSVLSLDLGKRASNALENKLISEVDVMSDIYINYRSKVWGHPDNFVSSMKTHFYLSNELKIE